MYNYATCLNISYSSFSIHSSVYMKDLVLGALFYKYNDIFM